jgi:hypothetical protein
VSIFPPSDRLEDSVDSLDSADWRRRMSLFLRVVGIVVGLSLLKAVIHWLGLEFLTLNPLFTSAIGGAIFIIGFLLSSILADYKESERLPSELRVALEGIHDDITCFAATHSAYPLSGVRVVLVNVVRSFTRDLTDDEDHGDLRPTLRHIDRLSPIFGELEQLGMPANFIVRLRAAQDTLRRGVFRIYHIQRTQFVPSIHILVYSLVASIVFLLLFLQTEGSPESALMFGFVSYMFTYALHLIRLLEKPFRKGKDTLDDVSLFLLREFDDKLTAAMADARREAAPSASVTG